MQLIQHWPEDLRERHDALSNDARLHLSAQEFALAAQGFEAAYRLVLAAQPKGRRYHKGESLCNVGLALNWLGRGEEALRATLAAFVEDAASLAEESPGFDELDRTAAHNLVYVFGIGGGSLIQLALHVRALIGSGRLLPDPYAILGADTALVASTPSAGSGTPRTVGSIEVPPERRVFIGGNYGRLVVTYRPLRDRLGTWGYDGLLAADFGIPDGWGEDEIELALLTNCHYAIFEVSESGGQIEEVADVPETMKNATRVLAVFDCNQAPEPGISRGQTLVKLARWGVKPCGYRDLDELAGIAHSWLINGSTSPATAPTP